MQRVFTELADEIVANLDTWSLQERIIITIASVPGGGKSTLAARVVELVNEHTRSKGIGDVAATLSMDGFHYPRAALDRFLDPEEAHRRRGAPFTFDSQGLVKVIEMLKRVPLEKVTAPSFDHQLKDPVEDDIVILPSHRVVLLEGLYVQLHEGDWAAVSKYATERWWIEVDLEVAADRTARRHVTAGLASTYEMAMERVRGNDLVNGQYVIAHSLPPTCTIRSVAFA
ncbi:P-loop containing nucleoside triphosphate hydrolase protein [Cladochytrium replicatum]|nr:P-loop containing nucleoside triphosphate hydrolase protein [Cladochytrium replicatum]